jgi:membrane protein GlpM
MFVVFKCAIGALIMLVIHYLAQTKHYFAAGLVLMLPAISLPTYYFMHLERGAAAVQNTALFGMLSVLAYLAFLGGLYWCEKRFPIVQSISLALGSWCVVALALLVVWKRLKP